MCTFERLVRSVRIYLRRKRREHKLRSAKKKSTRDSFNRHYPLDSDVINARQIPQGVLEIMIACAVFIVIYVGYLVVVTRTPASVDVFPLTQERGFTEYIKKSPKECRKLSVSVFAPPATQYMGLLKWLRSNPFYPMVDFERVALVDDLCRLLCRPETNSDNLTFFVFPTDPIERMIRHIRQYRIAPDNALQDIDDDLSMFEGSGAFNDFLDDALPMEDCISHYCYSRPKTRRRHYLFVWGMAPFLYQQFLSKNDVPIQVNYREGTKLDRATLHARIYELVDDCLPNGMPPDLFLHDQARATDLIPHDPVNIEDSVKALELLGIPDSLSQHLRDFYQLHSHQ